MNKTKIDWATMSWNPVTGCRHGCPYCYARRTARRFDASLEDRAALPGGLHVLEDKIKATPYPYGFEPTLHRYRLNQPERQGEPQTVFVCSMADLFGRWVPTGWIRDVLDACQRAPQHRYLFLTKNPARYLELDQLALLPHENNYWYGSTVTRSVGVLWYLFAFAFSCGTAADGISPRRACCSMYFSRACRWYFGGRSLTFMAMLFLGLRRALGAFVNPCRSALVSETFCMAVKVRILAAGAAETQPFQPCIIFIPFRLGFVQFLQFRVELVHHSRLGAGQVVDLAP